MKVGNLDVYGIIYKITNNVNGKVYIGQTVQEFERRYCIKGEDVERVYLRHKMLKDYGYGYNKHLLESFEKYGVENFELNKVLDFAFSKDELNIKEKIWISYYDSYKKGYNNNLGGDGNSGFLGLKGSKNPASRSVVQLSMNGDYINEYSYMTKAEEITGVSKSKITAVCKKDRKTAGGYIWVYSEEYYDENFVFKYTKNKTNAIPIVQLGLNGRFIKRYDSATEAEDSINIKRGAITRCCKGTRKSYNGYIWIYENEYDENKSYKYNAKSTGLSKSILAFDNNMNLIGEFMSNKEIVDKFGYSKTSIQNHLHNRGNKIKNHIFIYKEKYNGTI